MAASRRRFLLQLVAVSAALNCAVAVRAGDPESLGKNLPKSFDLKKQLETGLKARRPSDFTYIASIVAKVDAGTLPRKLVDQAFMYSRQRNPNYPLIYFQFTLKELTKKAGVTL